MYTGRLHVNGAQMQSVLKTSKQLRFLPFLQPEVMKYFDNVSLQNVDANASIETYEAVDAQNANPEIVEAMEQSSSAGNEADANNNTINLFDDDETSSDPIQRNFKFSFDFHFFFIHFTNCSTERAQTSNENSIVGRIKDQNFNKFSF